MKKSTIYGIGLVAMLVLTGCGGETKKEFYRDGELKYIAEYNSDSQLDGEYKSFYRNGKPYEVKFYSDGLLDGEYIEYTEKGQIEKIENYEDDVLHGEMKIYYVSGKLNEEATFKEGKLEGDYLMYWENGQLGRESEYSKGKHVGEEISYSKKGVLIDKKNYNDEGLYDGDHLYTYKGKPSVVAVFDDGVLESGYAFPKKVQKGWGYRSSSTTIGSKIILKNNRDFISIMKKNRHIGTYDSINGLAKK